MKHFQEKNMKFGYVIGNFDPSAIKTDCVEIAFKTMTKGTLDAGYYRKVDKEFLIILDGKLEVDKKIYGKGDIFVFDIGEIINLFAVDDTRIMIAKFPGTKGDFNKKKWSDYDELDLYYSYFLHRLKEVSETEESRKEMRKIITEHSEICSEDISVIVQGRVEDTTAFTLMSVRKYLPGAHIILSTWEGCDVGGLDYDELVYNRDPGAVDCSLWKEKKILNNGNRQIVSTKGGLERVKTEFTLKLRSDLLLLGNDFVKYYSAYIKKDSNSCLFKNRILIGELYTRHNFVYHRDCVKYDVPKPFHPSDWFVFGRTEDVHKLYDPVKLIPETELADYVCKYPERVEEKKYKYSWRYTTEQHIFMNFLKDQSIDIDFSDWTDWNDKNIEQSEELIRNNFIILNLCRHNILNLKYAAASFANNLISHPEEKLITYNEFRSFQ